MSEGMDSTPIRGLTAPFAAESVALRSRNMVLPEPKTPEELDANLAELLMYVKELKNYNPWVGQEVEILLGEDVGVVDNKTREKSTINGVVRGVFTSLGVYISQDAERTGNLDPKIGFKVAVEDEDGPKTITGETEKIVDIKLQKPNLPFNAESERFQRYTGTLKKALLQREAWGRPVDKDTVTIIMHNFIEEQLDPQSLLVGKTNLEMVFMDDTMIEMVSPGELTSSLRGKTLGSIEEVIKQEEVLQGIAKADENDNLDEQSEVEAIMIDDPMEYPFKGVLKSKKIVGYGFIWDDPLKDEPELTVLVEIDPNHILARTSGYNLANVKVNDIFSGRILSGPIAN